MLGFTKKGKQFYSFDTNLAEKISSFHVVDNSIWLTGEYTFTQLVDHAEAQFYIAPDRINDSDVSLAAPHCTKLHRATWMHYTGSDAARQQCD